MKLINLTQNKVAIVDDNWHEMLKYVKWQYSGGYAKNGASIVKNRCFMHRLICDLPSTKQGQVEVDHINGNTLDNRYSNLRIVSKGKNMRNMKRKVEFPGAYKYGLNRYFSRITHNLGVYYLGSYQTPEEAHLAYLMAVDCIANDIFIDR